MTDAERIAALEAALAEVRAKQRELQKRQDDDADGGDDYALLVEQIRGSPKTRADDSAALAEWMSEVERTGELRGHGWSARLARLVAKPKTDEPGDGGGDPGAGSGAGGGGETVH